MRQNIPVSIAEPATSPSPSGCVAIAAGEEGAGDGDGEEGGAADAEVAVVHVAALRSKPPGVNARQFNS